MRQEEEKEREREKEGKARNRQQSEGNEGDSEHEIARTRASQRERGQGIEIRKAGTARIGRTRTFTRERNLEVSIKVEGVGATLGRRHDAGLLVVADPLLEEVGLALQRDHVHPLEGVLNVILLGVAEGLQKSIGDEFDVLGH